MDLTKVIAKEYQKRLKAAGIPFQPSRRTADQETEARFIYFCLTLEVSADSRLNQEELEK